MTLSGSSAYRAEGRRRHGDDDDEDDRRLRDRSPHRSSYDRQDYSSGSYQPSSEKHKLAAATTNYFPFDKKDAMSGDPKKGSGIQMKLGGSSVSNFSNYVSFNDLIHYLLLLFTRYIYSTLLQLY